MMVLGTKGRYAARIMVCLAGHPAGIPVTKADIAEAEDISPDYVEQIMIRLKAAGLIRSHRGRNGGFSLTVDPELVTLAEILRAVEGPVAPVPCLHADCEREASCPTRPVWKKAAEAVERILHETTLARLAREREEEPSAAPMYYI